MPRPAAGVVRRLGSRPHVTVGDVPPRCTETPIEVGFVESLDDRILTGARSCERLCADARPLAREPVPARKEEREAHLGEGAIAERQRENKAIPGAAASPVAAAHVDSSTCNQCTGGPRGRAGPREQRCCGGRSRRGF